MKYAGQKEAEYRRVLADVTWMKEQAAINRGRQVKGCSKQSN